MPTKICLLHQTVLIQAGYNPEETFSSHIRYDNLQWILYYYIATAVQGQNPP